MKSILIFIFISATTFLSSCNYSQERLKDLSDIFDYKGGARLLPGLGIKAEISDLYHIGFGASETGNEKFGRRLYRPVEVHPTEVCFGCQNFYSNGPETVFAMAFLGFHGPIFQHRNRGRPGKHISTYWRFGTEIWLPFVDAGFYFNLGELSDFFAGFFGLDPSRDEGLPLHANYYFEENKEKTNKLKGAKKSVSPQTAAYKYHNNPTQILWSARWGPYGNKYAVGGIDALWIFDPYNNKRIDLYKKYSESSKSSVENFTVTAVEWHPEGKLLAVTSQNGNINGIFNVETGERIPLDTSQGRGVSWNPEGTRLALSNTAEGYLRIYSDKGQLLHDIPKYGDAKGLTAVDWSPDGKRLVTLGKYITLHDKEGKVLKQIKHRNDSEDLLLLLSVKWHPSGEFFAIGDYGNDSVPPVLQFWSKEGELIKTFPYPENTEIRNLSWSKDGEHLTTGTDQFYIRDKTGKIVYKSKEKYEAPFWGVDFHPYSKLVLLSFQDGQLIIKNTEKDEDEVIIGPSSS